MQNKKGHDERGNKNGWRSSRMLHEKRQQPEKLLKVKCRTRKVMMKEATRMVGMSVAARTVTHRGRIRMIALSSPRRLPETARRLHALPGRVTSGVPSLPQLMLKSTSTRRVMTSARTRMTGLKQAKRVVMMRGRTRMTAQSSRGKLDVLELKASTTMQRPTRKPRRKQPRAALLWPQELGKEHLKIDEKHSHPASARCKH